MRDSTDKKEEIKIYMRTKGRVLAHNIGPINIVNTPKKQNFNFKNTILSPI